MGELWSMLRYQAWSEAGIQALQNLAHRLAGSCATFGFNDVGDAARALEHFIQQKRALNTPIGGPERDRIQSLITELQAALNSAKDQINTEWKLGSASPDESSATQTVFIVDDDQSLASLIDAYFSRLGYQSEVFTNPTECIERLQEKTPNAIIMDLGFPEAPLLGISAMHSIRELTDNQVPIILISARADLAARVQALRAGAANFVSKPINFVELKNALLDSLHSLHKTIKVMIVDDDELSTALLAEQLNAVGIQVQKVNQPIHTLQKASQFKPDVVVLDMHMPKVNGLELATLMRQDPNFTLLPIVFLTSDDSQTLQNSLRALGVSAFLKKPASFDKLHNAILQAFEDAKALSRRVGRITRTDQSTNLVTRSYFFDALQRQLERKTTSPNHAAIIYLGVDNQDKLLDHYGRSGVATLHEQFMQNVSTQKSSQEQWTILSDLVACAIVDAADVEHLHARANNLIAYFEKTPLMLDMKPVTTTVSAGVLPLVLAPASVNGTVAQVERLYEQAKNAGAERLKIQADESNPQKIRFDPTRELPVDRFTLAYQPIVNIDTNASDYYDVLIRYCDEDNQLIAASQFIDELGSAERRMEVDRWVLQAAIRAIESDSTTRDTATLFIHISEDSLRQKLFLSFIANVLRSSRIRGDKRLVVMLDANWVTLHTEYALFVAKALRDARCGIGIINVGLDDWTLDLQKSLAPDFIKFKGAVARHLADPANDINALDSLLKGTGVKPEKCVVTQVEDSQTLSRFWQKGIRLFQGYFIHEPALSFLKKD